MKLILKILLGLIPATYLIPTKIKTKKYKFRNKPVIFFLWTKNVSNLLLNRKKNIKRQFEKQGPVFIKFAQWLSIRQDLLTPQQIESLSALQDKVPEHSFKYTQNVLKKEFGKKYKTIIHFLDTKTIGSGSLAQVYPIMYKGKKCIIKVLHPNIDLKVMADLNFIFLVKRFGKKNKKIKVLNQTFDIDLFCKCIIEQIDLNIEAKNLQKIKEQFKNINKVIIPELYYSSENIIIESLEIGDKYQDFIIKNPEKEKEAHTLITWVIRKMLLNHNFIHADLHHGNMLFKIIDDEVYITLIDFGLVGNLDNESLEHLNKFLKYLFFIDRNAEADLLESFNKNKNRSDEIKQIIKNNIRKNENEPISLIQKHNLTLKQLMEVPDEMLESLVPQEIIIDKEHNDMIQLLLKNNVLFDFFKLSTFLMIDSVETIINHENEIDALKYNKYRLIYGKDNNFYDFDKDKFTD